jgi:hypothetical protein
MAGGRTYAHLTILGDGKKRAEAKAAAVDANTYEPRSGH